MKAISDLMMAPVAHAAAAGELAGKMVQDSLRAQHAWGDATRAVYEGQLRAMRMFWDREVETSAEPRPQAKPATRKSAPKPAQRPAAAEKPVPARAEDKSVEVKTNIVVEPVPRSKGAAPKAAQKATTHAPSKEAGKTNSRKSAAPEQGKSAAPQNAPSTKARATAKPKVKSASAKPEAAAKSRPAPRVGTKPKSRAKARSKDV